MKAKQRNVNPESDNTIAVIEGRLVDKNENSVEIEIMDGLAIEISGPNINEVKKVEDEDSARGFVQIEISLEDMFQIDVNPTLVSEAFKSVELPLAFASKQGLAFGTDIPEPDFGSAIEGDKGGKCGEEFFFPLTLSSEPNKKTRSAYRSCKRYTRSIWGITCDKYIADINGIDDPKRAANQC